MQQEHTNQDGAPTEKMATQSTVTSENSQATNAGIPNIDELMQRVKQLEQSKERVLEESKYHKSKYQELKAQREEEHKRQLEESGNYKELLEAERRKVQELKQESTNLRKTTLSSNLKSEVAKHASNAWDIDDVVSNLPRDILEMDEDTLTVKNVADAVALVKERKPYLFDERRPTGMQAGRPSVDVPKEETFDDLLKKDPRAAFKNALRGSGLV